MLYLLLSLLIVGLLNVFFFGGLMILHVREERQYQQAHPQEVEVIDSEHELHEIIDTEEFFDKVEDYQGDFS